MKAFEIKHLIRVNRIREDCMSVLPVEQFKYSLKSRNSGRNKMYSIQRSKRKKEREKETHF